MVVTVLVALLVGAGAGFAVGAVSGDDAPGPTAPSPVDAAPVPATPSLPVEEISPDPDDPPLLPGIELVTETLTVEGTDDEPSYEVTLPTPAGWGRRFDGVAKWTYTVTGTDVDPYGLRVTVIADQDVSVATALRSRTAALESAETQDNLDDLQIDVAPTGDGFTSSYVKNGFRTISVERFYGGDDSSAAFATVAAYGREADREGLTDLLALVSRDLRTEVVEAPSRR